MTQFHVGVEEFGIPNLHDRHDRQAAEDLGFDPSERMNAEQLVRYVIKTAKEVLPPHRTGWYGEDVVVEATIPDSEYPGLTHDVVVAEWGKPFHPDPNSSRQEHETHTTVIVRGVVVRKVHPYPVQVVVDVVDGEKVEVTVQENATASAEDITPLQLGAVAEVVHDSLSLLRSQKNIADQAEPSALEAVRVPNDPSRALRKVVALSRLNGR
jgi:hypothetical protein